MNLLPLYTDPFFALIGAWFGWKYGGLLYGCGVRLRGKLQLRQAPLLSVLSLLFIFGNIAFFFVRNRPAFEWYLPLSVDYYATAVQLAVNLALMGFIFATVTRITHSEFRRLVWFMAILSVLVLAGADAYTRTSPGSRPVTLLAPRITADGVVLQTCGSSCAAASGANIARHFGIDKTEREMAMLMGTTDGGTTPAQMAHALHQLGLAVAKHAVSDRDICKVHAPAILSVDLVGMPDGHAVAFMGMRDGRAEIWDPGSGKHFETPQELSSRWRGRALEVSRAGKK